MQYRHKLPNTSQVLEPSAGGGYPPAMEIPLTLRKNADGSISYGIPLWYRIATGAMLAFVAGGAFSAGGRPSLVAWIVIALLGLGMLYEERWTVDPKARTLSHRAGILPAVKTQSFGFDEVAELRLSAFARGTIPGSPEEEADKERAFSMMRGKDSSPEGDGAAKPSPFKMNRRKPYMNLIVDAKSGESFLVDALPARSAARLLKAGSAIAEAVGVPFSDKELDSAGQGQA